MKHRYYFLVAIIILIILIGITLARSYDKVPSLTASGLTVCWLVGLLGFNYIINETILEDRLSIEDKLLQYPRYKLTLTGAGLIACMMLLDSPATRLTGAFAVASIFLGRDHRWSAFLALDMLGVIIISLIIKEQGLADLYAIYLYYFLVIATVTMIVNSKSEDLEKLEDLEVNNQLD